MTNFSPLNVARKLIHKVIPAMTSRCVGCFVGGVWRFCWTCFCLVWIKLLDLVKGNQHGGNMRSDTDQRGFVFPSQK